MKTKKNSSIKVDIACVLSKFAPVTGSIVIIDHLITDQLIAYPTTMYNV